MSISNLMYLEDSISFHSSQLVIEQLGPVVPLSFGSGNANHRLIIILILCASSNICSKYLRKGRANPLRLSPIRDLLGPR